jgi:hypothetical protein
MPSKAVGDAELAVVDRGLEIHVRLSFPTGQRIYTSLADYCDMPTKAVSLAIPKLVTWDERKRWHYRGQA